MSYSEYFDMFFDRQEKDCKYRAFTFDVVHSREQELYLKDKPRFFMLIDCVYSLLEKEELSSQMPILLKDKFNKRYSFGMGVQNGNEINPMILGDMMTFFVYNQSISSERMLELFIDGLRKLGIDYPFHFNTGVYETNNYIEGGSKLFKGYIFV